MAYETQRLLVAEDGAALRDAAARFRELPTMPRTVNTVLQQLKSSDWSIPALEATIAADPDLVERVIAVSNSAMYAAAQEIRTLNQALVRLGYRGIRSLMIVTGARALFPLDDLSIGDRARELWRHSATCAVAARLVAEAVNLRDPDDAFAAGVLHDIGKVMILTNSPDDYERIQQLIQSGRCDSCVAEMVIVGVDHARLAAGLTSRWHLPDTIIAGVTGHHDPEQAGEHASLARVVACADRLARLHAGDDPAVLVPEIHDDLAGLGLDFATAEELLRTVLTHLANPAELV